MVSVALHAIFALFALLPLGGGLPGAVAQAGGDRGDMTVTLVSVQSLTAASPTPTKGSLRPLFASLATASDGVPVDRDAPSGLGQLFSRVSKDSNAAATNALARRVAEAAQEQRAIGETGNGEPEEGSGPPTLWGLVQPCWTGLSRRAVATVTLDVALDARGRISTPPQILRAPGAALDERQLRAEALALSALSACTGQAQPQLGGHSYRLSFRPERPRRAGS